MSAAEPTQRAAARGGRATHEGRSGHSLSVRKVSLLIATALVAINVWTGSPLLALWVGSQVQGSFGSPKIEAVGVVVVVLAALVYASAFALAWLNARYDALTGRRRTRQPYPWLRSMRAERQVEVRRELGVTAVERAVVISVVAAALAFEVWFFFFAGSSLPSN
jgi:hypothetical protein